jgi:hypothetical protein
LGANKSAPRLNLKLSPISLCVNRLITILIQLWITLSVLEACSKLLPMHGTQGVKIEITGLYQVVQFTVHHCLNSYPLDMEAFLHG